MEFCCIRSAGVRFQFEMAVVDFRLTSSAGTMLCIGRSNYLRFNHPAEARLMKSILPSARLSMAPLTLYSGTVLLPFVRNARRYEIPYRYRGSSYSRYPITVSLHLCTLRELLHCVIKHHNVKPFLEVVAGSLNLNYR